MKYMLIVTLGLFLTACASQPPAPPTPTPKPAMNQKPQGQKLQITAPKLLATFDTGTGKIEYEKDATPEDVIKILLYENVQMGQKLKQGEPKKEVEKKTVKVEKK